MELVRNFTSMGFEDFRKSRKHLLAERKRDYHKRCVLEFFEEHSDLCPRDVADLLKEAETDAERGENRCRRNRS